MLMVPLTALWQTGEGPAYLPGDSQASSHPMAHPADTLYKRFVIIIIEQRMHFVSEQVAKALQEFKHTVELRDKVR